MAATSMNRIRHTCKVKVSDMNLNEVEKIEIFQGCYCSSVPCTISK